MLKVTSYSSRGRATRIQGIKDKKIYHLHSDNQLRVFLILEWSDNVIDITLNKKLVNLEATIPDLENLMIDRFRDKDTGNIYNLYTNFLITTKDNNEKTFALAVRPALELEKKNVVEKLEIERRYWESKGIKFFIITDKEINRQFADNIIWVRETLTDKTVRNKEQVGENLYYYLQEYKNETVINVLSKFDSEEMIENGTGLFLFRYLIAKKEIAVNMKEAINLKEKVEDIVKF